MNTEALNVVIKAMQSMADEYGSIEEEWYRKMFGLIAEIAEGRSDSFDAVQARQLPALKSFISKYETAYSLGEIGDNEQFTDGSCWAIAGIVNAAASRIEKQVRSQRQDDMASTHYSILRYIDLQPGITQKELVEASGKRKSNLSQILSRLEEAGLVLIMSQGRCHHHYLSLEGKAAFDRVWVGLTERFIEENALWKLSVNARSVSARDKTNSNGNGLPHLQIVSQRNHDRFVFNKTNVSGSSVRSTDSSVAMNSVYATA